MGEKSNLNKEATILEDLLMLLMYQHKFRVYLIC